MKKFFTMIILVIFFAGCSMGDIQSSNEIKKSDKPDIQ